MTVKDVQYRKTFRTLINIIAVTISCPIICTAQGSIRLDSVETYDNALALLSTGFQYKAEAHNEYVPEAVSVHSKPGTDPSAFASKYSIDFKTSSSGAYQCLMKTLNGKGEFMEFLNCGYDGKSYYCLNETKVKRLTTTIEKPKAERSVLWQIGYRELLTFLLGFANPSTQLETNNIPSSRGGKDVIQAIKIMRESSFEQDVEGHKTILINANDVHWKVRFDEKRLFPQSVEYFHGNSILFKCVVTDWQNKNNVEIPAQISFEQYDYYAKVLTRKTFYKITEFSFGSNFVPEIPFSEAAIIYDLDSNTTQRNP